MAEVKIGAHFTARFDSTCAWCDGPIEEGEPAGWLDNEVGCANCYRGECYNAGRNCPF